MLRTGRQAFCILLLGAILSACSAPAPSWRSKVAPLVENLGVIRAPALYPQEYRSLLETFEHGEALCLVREDDKGADFYYRLAFQKAEILQVEIQQLNKRLAAEKQQLVADLAAKAEEEQLMRAAAEAEIRLRKQQAALAAETARAAQKKNREPPPLPTFYTVRRGETLPQISARTEIYNDSTLWPIIYRANRDQIRNPKRLWPGQVFVIPRNFSHDEAVEARRYSNKNN
ncbi:MAG: LysM peptidoglycan-binding domain-containing protein [Desulfuromonadaceae bacterium]